jgi:hypothetical protein
MFEEFVLNTCSERAFKSMMAIIANSDHDVTVEEFNETFQSEKLLFHGHALCVCSRINNNCQKQLYYRTLNAVFHGLSRSGIEVQAQYGFMMKLSTFDDTRNRDKIDNDERLR